MSEKDGGSGVGQAGPRPELEHNAPRVIMGDDGVTPEQDAMLRAMASVVVDELMALRSKGMTPADIERLYDQRIPAIPAIPKRKRRQGKERT